MKSKIFLAFLLFTPPLVLLISTLSFQSGFSPINTKNNGVFFSEYFDVKDLNLINDKKVPDIVILVSVEEQVALLP